MRADNVRVTSAGGSGKTQCTARCPVCASHDTEIAAPQVSVEPRSHVSARVRIYVENQFTYCPSFLRVIIDDVSQNIKSEDA
jgi:hypothetical protein